MYSVTKVPVGQWHVQTTDEIYYYKKRTEKRAKWVSNIVIN